VVNYREWHLSVSERFQRAQATNTNTTWRIIGIVVARSGNDPVTWGPLSGSIGYETVTSSQERADICGNGEGEASNPH